MKVGVENSEEWNGRKDRTIGCKWWHSKYQNELNLLTDPSNSGEGYTLSIAPLSPRTRQRWQATRQPQPATIAHHSSPKPLQQVN